MYYRQLASTAVLALQVSARAVHTLSKRDLIVNPDGNVGLNFNDNLISFGTLNPIDVINSLYSNCYDQGDCNGAPYTMSTWVPSDGYGAVEVPLTVTITTGDFTPWVKNGMIAAAAAAAQNGNVAQVSQVTILNEPSCETCPPSEDSLTQYSFPQSISISFDSNGPDRSIITAGFSVAMPTTPGFCQTFTSFTSALISPINAATGGVLSFIGSYCGTD